MRGNEGEIAVPGAEPAPLICHLTLGRRRSTVTSPLPTTDNVQHSRDSPGFKSHQSRNVFYSTCLDQKLQTFLGSSTNVGHFYFYENKLRLATSFPDHIFYIVTSNFPKNLVAGKSNVFLSNSLTYSHSFAVRPVCGRPWDSCVLSSRTLISRSRSSDVICLETVPGIVREPRSTRHVRLQSDRIGALIAVHTGRTRSLQLFPITIRQANSALLLDLLFRALHQPRSILQYMLCKTLISF